MYHTTKPTCDLVFPKRKLRPFGCSLGTRMSFWKIGCFDWKNVKGLKHHHDKCAISDFPTCCWFGVIFDFLTPNSMFECSEKMFFLCLFGRWHVGHFWNDDCRSTNRWRNDKCNHGGNWQSEHFELATIFAFAKKKLILQCLPNKISHFQQMHFFS